MSAAGPPPGQPTQAQMQQILQAMAAEAQRRGITIQELQRQQMAAEAAKRGLTPEAFERQQMEAEATRRGMTLEQFRQTIQVQRQAQQQQQQQKSPQTPGQLQVQPQAQPQAQQQQIPVDRSAPPKPEALAVAKFLRGQNLKTRSCILDGQRKDLFKVKRALRALQSSAYDKAQKKKNSALPEVKDDSTARQALQLLPMSMLALRVTKSDPHEGHDHAKPVKDPKRIKGLWTVKVEPRQEFEPLMHYVWLYDGPQWKQKAMAGGVLVAIMAVVMFPLWPIVLRQGVWYLSVGAMGLLGLFFAMAIFRLILFCLTVFTVPPGLWLFPNLFEDVGFFDSFKPLWGWQENKKAKKKSKTSIKGAATQDAAVSGGSNGATAPESTATGSEASTTVVTKRHMAPQVEEVDDE